MLRYIFLTVTGQTCRAFVPGGPSENTAPLTIELQKGMTIMSLYKFVPSNATTAINITNPSIAKMFDSIRAARRRDRALKTINSLDRRIIEDVAISRAHAINAARRGARSAKV